MATLAATGLGGFVGTALVGVAQEVLRIRRADDGWQLPEGPCEILIHLAGRAHCGGTLADFRCANRDATFTLFDQARERGLQRFVFVSTIGVHGKASRAAIDADTAVDPCEPYAIAKWEAEEGLRERAASDGIELVILRPTLVTGPGAPGNLARMRGLLARGLDPFAGLTNRRSYCDREALVRALLVAAGHPGCVGGTYPICDTESVRTCDVARALAEGAGWHPLRIPVPSCCWQWLRLAKPALVAGLTGQLRVDPSAFARDTGWQPTTDSYAPIRRASADWPSVTAESP